MNITQETNDCTAEPSVDVIDVPLVDEMNKESVKPVVENNSVGVCNFECELEQPATIAVQARNWFTKLSSEERSGATSFSDGAFLGAFIAFASPWSHEDRSIRGSGGASTVNAWDAMVSIKEFEMKYHELESSLKETPKLANRKSAESGIGDVVPVGNDLCENDKQNLIKSDEFRIRKFNDLDLHDALNGTTKDFTPNNASLLRRQIFDQAVLIFPSVFKNITGTMEHTPHVVIRPSYFDNASDEEQFLAFTAHTGNEDSFLSFNFSSSDRISASWLCRFTLDFDMAEDISVPLSSLLTARLEWAAWESFLEFEFNKTSQVDDSRSHLLSILGDILSHCRAVSDLSLTIDSSTLAKFAAPLCDSCLRWDESFDQVILNNFEGLFLTPFSWILRAIDAASTFDLHNVDAAIDLSLQRMEEHKPEVPKDLTNSSDDDVGVSDDLLDSKRVLEQAPQPKKKKKNKKKKSKKLVGSESPNVSVEQSELPIAEPDEVKLTGSVSVVEPPPMSPSELVDDDDANVKVDSTDGEFVSDSLEVASVDSDDTVDDLNLLRRSFADLHVEKNDDSGKGRQDGKTVIATPFGNDVAIGSSITVANMENAASEENALGSTDWDSWETVEVRGRGGRKKPLPPPPPPPPPAMNPRPQTTFIAPSSDSYGKNNKQGKYVRPAPTPWKKSVARKIVRDILTAVIDSVDDESRKARHSRVASPAPAVNSWKNGPPGASPKDVRSTTSVTLVNSGKPEPTMCDIIMGKHTESKSPIKPNSVNNIGRSEGTKAPIAFPSSPMSGEFTKDEKSSPKTDQNTAPTYQDSASSSSNARPDSKEEPERILSRKSDGSSSDNEAPQNCEGDLASKYDTVDASTPPLPTLLTPENANSSTSSVASSLEAPHRGRPHHHDTVPDVNDVGYHLLDVCDRLSRDMSLFMSRRALALSARRRERGAIVSALQSSVSSIWPGQSHVELYGSCATQLDLPSSDIDVVVLGLNEQSFRSSSMSNVNQSEISNSESVTACMSFDDAKQSEDMQQVNVLQLVPSASFGMLPHHRNAERVVRLAADLEKKTWAVQVNAIPTASVPVIKVLADPSKLVASTGTDWITQHQQLPCHSASAAGSIGSFESRPNPEYSKADSGSYPPPTHVPWRGSDVMKGLLSLDITFEGPEHGGIGSTEFSSQIVAEACAEAGLDSDATPFVQTLMVLKELLAQRKLNEPYSGGLSSYALLLLVLALVRERAVIREEIALVEQQRRAMAVEEPNSYASVTVTPFDPVQSQPTPTKSSDKLKNCNINAAVHIDKSNGKCLSQAKPNPAFKASSWANIAKGNSGGQIAPSVSVTNGKSGNDVCTPKAAKVEAPPQKPSFADAVTGSKGPTLQVSNVARSSEKCHEGKVVGEKSLSASLTPSGKTSVGSRTSEPTVSPIDTKMRAPAFYPQGYNDIVEVLCSGEITAGKLLMHFLLYYGQHFDAQSTAIDISGKHERTHGDAAPLNSYVTPYIQRQSLGTIDPRTGMLTVDPIVIYDPLEGAENNNVARRCFAWNSVRWIFAQSYATLASAVERSATPPTTPGGGTLPPAVSREGESDVFLFSPDGTGDLMDPSSPLLRCLLSF